MNVFFSGKFKQLICLLLFGFLVFSPVIAADISENHLLVISKENHRVSLEPYISMLVDTEHNLQIADIPVQSTENFQPLLGMSNSMGFSDAVFWLHFKLKGTANAPDSMLLTLEAPLVDQVTLFVPYEDGFVEQRAGDKVPYSQRQIKHRNPAFFISVPKKQSADFYLRVQSDGPIQIPMTIWSMDRFIAYQEKAQLFFGAYYGLMMILSMASFYVFILLKEQVFFRYSLYLSTFLLFQMSINGVSFQFFWGEFPQIASQINASLVGAVIMSALWFSSDFLKVKQYSPISYKLFRILNALTALCVLFIWTDLFQIATKMVVWCGIILVPVFTLTAVQVLRQGYKPARYFSLAWSILMMGVFTAGLRFSGILPANFFTIYSMQISSTLEIIILVLALVDRFKVIYKAKSIAEVQANEAIFKLNHQLEMLVSERTQALEESNKRLEKLATQDSLTGLLNHSASIEQIESALNGARRYNYATAVIMLDIDYFKLLNDRYGHQAGDDILRAIADALSSSLRKTDSCGRYGGEEFIFVLTHAEIVEVRALGERLKEIISRVRSERAPGAKVTASLGIAMCYPNQSQNYSVDTLIAAADKALYEAKEQGRNRVCFAPDLQLTKS